MKTTTRSRAASAAAAAVIMVVLTACQWSMPRFDAAGSGHNSAETSIGVGNAASVGLVSSAVASGPTTGGTPVVAGGLVYVTSKGTGGGLRAYATDGGTGCTGAPATCTPVWSAAATGDVGQAAVTGGFVYVAVGADLHAYDAAGVTGCSGTPTSCAPLWTAPGWGGEPVVDGGRLFVSSGVRLGSFDAAGVAGCSGSPKVCTPSWTFELPDPAARVAVSPPAVSDGVVYVGSFYSDGFINGGHYGYLFALDAAGVDGCSGTPTTCTPQWSTGAGAILRSPAVVDGMVWVNSRDTGEYEIEDETVTTGHSNVVGFDISACAAGGPGCVSFHAQSALGSFGRPYSIAVADGLVHASWNDPVAGFSVATFVAAPAPSCTLSVSCAPIRIAPSPAAGDAELTVANGVVYAGRTAFDATGATGCTGAPAVCSPIWTAPVPATGNRTFFASNGKVMGLVDTGSTQTLSIFDTP